MDVGSSVVGAVFDPSLHAEDLAQERIAQNLLGRALGLDLDTIRDAAGGFDEPSVALLDRKALAVDP